MEKISLNIPEKYELILSVLTQEENLGFINEQYIGATFIRTRSDILRLALAEFLEKTEVKRLWIPKMKTLTPSNP